MGFAAHRLRWPCAMARASIAATCAFGFLEALRVRGGDVHGHQACAPLHQRAVGRDRRHCRRRREQLRPRSRPPDRNCPAATGPRPPRAPRHRRQRTRPPRRRMLSTGLTMNWLTAMRSKSARIAAVSCASAESRPETRRPRDGVGNRIEAAVHRRSRWRWWCFATGPLAKSAERLGSSAEDFLSAEVMSAIGINPHPDGPSSPRPSGMAAAPKRPSSEARHSGSDNAQKTAGEKPHRAKAERSASGAGKKGRRTFAASVAVRGKDRRASNAWLSRRAPARRGSRRAAAALRRGHISCRRRRAAAPPRRWQGPPPACAQGATRPGRDRPGPVRPRFPPAHPG